VNGRLNEWRAYGVCGYSSASVQEQLQSLESFIADVRLLNLGNAARH
jgi:hypothetical protein